MLGMSNDELLNTAEAAELLEVSVPTVTRWVRDGLLKPARKLTGLRGGYVFARESLETAKAAQRRRPERKAS